MRLPRTGLPRWRSVEAGLAFGFGVPGASVAQVVPLFRRRVAVCCPCGIALRAWRSGFVAFPACVLPFLLRASPG